MKWTEKRAQGPLLRTLQKDACKVNRTIVYFLNITNLINPDATNFEYFTPEWVEIPTGRAHETDVSAHVRKITCKLHTLDSRFH